ncbi:MAG: SH3 domain-containing protein [Candidatus Binatia bacterium]
MRSLLLPLCGVLLILLGLVPAGDARTLVLREGARFREGPGKTTRLLGELPTGVSLEVLGEDNGWLRVLAPDGREGYVWGEHVGSIPEVDPEGTRRPAESVQAAPSGASATPPKEPAAATVQESLAALRSDVAALRERPEPATATELDSLRTEVKALSEAQRDLAQRLERRLGSGDEPPASAAALGWLGLGIGILLGWFGALLIASRRDRHQASRLRL